MTERSTGLARTKLRLIAVAALAMASAWGVVGIYSLRTALPDNPIKLPFESRKQMRTFLPQGWAFFTRAAQEPRQLILRREGGDWVSAQEASAAPSELFGIRRRARARGVEMALIVARLPRSSWHECDGGVEACLDDLSADLTIHNDTPNPSLCGDMAFVQQRPVPWAWQRRNRTIDMPAKIARVRLAC